MASTKQKLECLKGWLAFIEGEKIRKKKKNGKKLSRNSSRN